MAERLTIPQITRRIRQADHVLLCCDYDGTLTPIRRTPEAATPSAALRTTLRRFQRHAGFHTAVISGRGLSDIRRLIGVPGLYYAGNHGLELAGPGVSFRHPAVDDALPAFKSLAPGLTALRRQFPGLLVEDKHLSLSVHYRLVDAQRAPDLRRQLLALLRPALDANRLRVTRGKCVFELRPPVRWNKGSAVRWLRQHVRALTGAKHLLTVMLGDDITDEDAFRVLRRGAGIGIRVGRDTQRTAAVARLRSVGDAVAWLNAISRLPAPSAAVFVHRESDQREEP